METGYFGGDQASKIARDRIQDRWQDAYAPVRHVDVLLVISALALTIIGAFMIYSATKTRLAQAGLPEAQFATRQLLMLGAATVAMVLVATFDYRYFRAYSAVAYGAVLVGLMMVLTPLGVEVNGATRWIEFGAFQLQPSEVAKIAVIVVLAALFHERKTDPRLPTIAVSLAIVGVPMGLIYLQPDLGTMIVFVWIAFVALLAAGVPVGYLVVLGVTGLGAVIGVFKVGLLADYQIQRLTGFLDAGNPELAQSVLYNANQSQIAIGSGQLAGKGFLNGTQTNLAYVPENHTDFVFTVVGEEFGFVGAALVLALFAILLWRGLRIAAMAKDTFGRVIAASIVGLLGFQMFINVGMTVGIMPVTGIPLPFVSYGGTALITSWIMIGLLQNIHMRRF